MRKSHETFLFCEVHINEHVNTVQNLVEQLAAQEELHIIRKIEREKELIYQNDCLHSQKYTGILKNKVENTAKDIKKMKKMIDLKISLIESNQIAYIFFLR